jgi:hypothetical protein
LTTGRRHNRHRNKDNQVANSLEEEQQIPLEDLGGATGGDDDDTLNPIIHSAPNKQAEAKTVEETNKNVPLKKRKQSP